MNQTRVESELPDYGYVSAEVLAGARCFTADSETARATIGHRDKRTDYAGLVIPYFWPGLPHARQYRLRLFRPSNGRKYLSEYGVRNAFYIHPSTPADWLLDTTIPVVFVEGEKKALAVWRFFQERREEILVIGLSGVSNWRCVIGVERDAGGHIVKENKGPIPDFDRLQWEGRLAYILFDANVHHNEQVQGARRGLTRVLQKYSALVIWVDLPADLPAELNGVDDFISKYGAAAFAELWETQTDREALGAESALLPLTDKGMLDRLCELYENEFVFVEAWARWGAWDGAKWDFTNGRARLQAALIHTADEAILQETTHKPLDKFIKFCRRYQNQSGVRAATLLAEHDLRFRREVEDFDKNPWLVNCANGTLDARTGELREPERADYITRQIATAYDPDAQCPAWESFVEQILLHKPAMIRFVWQMLGYCLTGDVSDQVFFILVGKGENGKGVLLQTYEYILGKAYFRHAAASAFEDHNFVSGHTDAIAALFGARAVLASETNQTARLNEALIKRVTGEQTITASRKGQQNFEFAITFKVLMSVNYLPEINGMDHGIWRRVIPIPFDFTVTERDEDLPAKLKAEAAGILAWCVRGLHDKLTEGLRIPDECLQLRKEYREDSNRLSGFFEAKCVINSKCKILSGDLWKAYLEYCQQTRQARPLQRNRAFADCLKDKGCELSVEKDSENKAQRYWKGIGLALEFHEDGSVKYFR